MRNVSLTTGQKANNKLSAVTKGLKKLTLAASVVLCTLSAQAQTLPAFEAEPNGSTALATPITTNPAKVRGYIYTNGDIDFYSFAATAGDKVYAALQTSFSSNASTDAQLRIIASDGSTVLEFDDDEGQLGSLSSSIAGTVIPSTGTYYIQVNHFSATNQLRPYDLYLRLQSGSPTAEVEPNDVPASANTLAAGGWMSGTRDPALSTEMDFFAVTLAAGESVFLSLDLDPERDGVNWNGRLGFALFGDASNQILVVDDANAAPTLPAGNSEAFFYTVKDAGTYYVFVDAASAATGGPTATYNVSVSTFAADPGYANYPYTGAATGITNPGSITSTITIPDSKIIKDLSVRLNISHPLMADLDATLTSPGGNIMQLFTDIGAAATGGQAQMDLVLNDNNAVPPAFTVMKGVAIQPELQGHFDYFKGMNSAGTWTLTLYDDGTNVSAGTLNGWSIDVLEDATITQLQTGPNVVTIYSQDFEANDGSYTHSGTQDEWAWGTPATPGTTTLAPITTANSGVNAWKTDLTGSYNASSDQILESPNIDLTTYLSTDLFVTWAMKYQMESASFDRLEVTIEEVGGSGLVQTAFVWYGATQTTSGGSPSVSVPQSSGWGTYSVNVGAFAGKIIRVKVRVISDSSIHYSGVAIDDVRVYLLCPTITLSPATLPDAAIGAAYNQTITQTGGADPVTYAVTSGTLPAGLSLSSGGALTGTPTALGTSNFTVTATDANGCTGDLAYSIAVVCSTVVVNLGGPYVQCEGTVTLDAGGTGAASSFTEGLDAGTAGLAYTPTGWFQQNNSTIPGSTQWFTGNNTVFASQSGTGYIAANFNNTTGNNTISNWLLTPNVTLRNGDVFSFWTRTVTSPAFPDRLQVRMSTNGASTNVGVTSTDEGDFTNLLLDINPTLTTGGYPNVWTQYSVTISGLGGPTSGRLAFRYFVTSGGPSGANSDYIGVDEVVYTSVGGSTYAWSDGITTTQTLTVSSSGSYSVTVTDEIGCTGTGSASVTINTNPVVNLGGPYVQCQGSVLLDAGNAGSSYAWSDGATTTQTLSAGVTGVYSVTVTDANTCSSTASASVTINEPPTSTDPYAVCVGTFVPVGEGLLASGCGSGQSAVSSFTGTTTLADPVFNRGLTGTTYTASGVGTAVHYQTHNFTVSATGSYTFTLCGTFDTYLHIYTDPFNPASPATNFLVADDDAALCGSGSEATITLTAGTNYVFVVTGFGNTDVGDYTVTFTGAGSVLQGTPNTIEWYDVASGGVVMGSGSPFDPVGTLALPNTNTPGTYTFYAACSLNPDCRVPVDFVVNANPVIDLGGPYVQCGGSVTLDPGNFQGSYAWSDGVTTTQTLTVSSTGTYSVTVTDEAGCTGVGTASVTINSALVVSITGTTGLCAGATGTLTATSTSTNFAWSTGETTAAITVSSPGNYSVTVTDGGCTASASHSVAALSDFTVNGSLQSGDPLITSPRLFRDGIPKTCGVVACPGVLGSSGYFYDSYSVVNNGNTAICASANVTTGCGTEFFAAAYLGSFDPSNVCTNYSQDIGSSLTGSFTFDIPALSTVTVVISGVNPGVSCGAYTLEVTGITQPVVITPSGPTTFCSYESVDLTANGAVGYVWSTTETTPTITVNTAATYTVTGTDFNGCTTTDSEDITVNPAPVVDLGGPYVQCSGTVTLDAGNAGAGGSFTEGLDAGGAGVTYTPAGWFQQNNSTTLGLTEWFGGNNGVFAPQSGAGYIAANFNNTTGGDDISNWLLTPNITMNDGDVFTFWTRTVSFPAFPDRLQVRMSTSGASTNVGVGSAAVGDFTTLLLDINPTLTTVDYPTTWTQYSVTISGLGAPTSGRLAFRYFVPNGGPAGANSDYIGIDEIQYSSVLASTYIWSDGVTTTQTLTVGTSGTYSVTVTDVNGCTGTGSADVTINPLPVIDLGGPYIQCEGSVTLDAGNPGSTYLWSVGAASGQTITVTTSGIYSVTVTDGNGCSASASVSVTINLPPAVTLGDTVCQYEILTPGEGLFATGCGNVLSSFSGTTTLSDPVFVRSVGGTTYNPSGIGNAVHYATHNFTVSATGSYTFTLCGYDTYLHIYTSPFNPASPATNFLIADDDGAGSCTFGSETTITLTAGTIYTFVVTGFGNNDVGPYTVNFAGPGFVLEDGSGGVLWFDALTGGTQVGSGSPFNPVGTSVLPNTNTPGTYTFYVACASTSDCRTPVDFLVFPTPTVNIGGPYTQCGGNVVLDAGNTGSAYTWSDGTSNQTTVASTSGNYSVTVTNTDNCSASAEANVYIQPVPVVNLGLDVTQCGDSVTLDAGTPGSTYLWSDNSTNQTLTVNTTGTYSVTVSDINSSCTASDNVDVTINEIPVVDLGSDVEQCGGSVTLNAGNPGAAYLWSTGETTQTITVSTTGIYRVTVTSGDGCSGTGTINVTINTVPSLGPDKTDSVCPGYTVDLNLYYPNTGYASYVWDTPNPSVAGAGAYKLVVISAAGCSDTAVVTILNRQQPNLGPDLADSICIGYTYDLWAVYPNSGAYVTYIWDTPTPSEVTAGTYTLIVTNASGCSDTVVAVITMRQQPDLGPDKADSVCIGYTLDLTTYYPDNGYATYVWDTQTPSAVGAGTYTLIVSNASGCYDTATIVITNRQQPVVTLDMANEMCYTEPAFTLTGGLPVGGTYVVGDSVGVVIFDPVAQGVGVHHITYIYTNASGCTDSASIDFIVRPQPNITTIAPPDLCTGSAPMNLNDYFSPTGGVFTGFGVSQNYFYPALTGAGNDTIIYYYTDLFGCKDTAVYPLSVKNSVDVSLVASEVDFTICRGDSVIFTASGAEFYEFFVNGVSQGEATTTDVFVTTSLGSHDEVYVVGSNSCSTDTSESIIIDVITSPTVTAGSDTTIELGQMVVLETSATGTGSLVYQWAPDFWLNFTNVPNPTYSGPDTVTFVVRVTDTYGCFGTDSITINVYVPDNVLLPNILTTNDDGKNDLWILNSKINLDGAELVIFNRWGELVYESESYTNDWDGTFKDTGKKLPDDTYYYVLKVPMQNNHVYKGAINILNSNAK